MDASERLEAYAAAIARAAAALAAEEPQPPACRAIDCAAPAKLGCAGYCPRCWADRRSRADLY